MKAWLLGSAAVYATAIVAACGGTAVIDPPLDGNGGSSASSSANSAANSASNSSSPAATTTTSASTSSGMPGCMHDAPDIFELCVRGQPDGMGGEIISVGSPPYFELRPGGCYSGSCTIVHQADCKVTEFNDPEIFVDGQFCIEDTSGQGDPCTDDCMLVTGRCDEMVLLDGGYSVTYQGLTVLFTVPQQLPAGGSCAAFDF